MTFAVNREYRRRCVRTNAQNPFLVCVRTNTHLYKYEVRGPK
jgi:hypothetical protein